MTRSTRSSFLVLAGAALLASGCAGDEGHPHRATDAGPTECAYGLSADPNAGLPTASGDDPLRINEVMASNDGAWVDEEGETDDFIELINTGDASIRLGDYRIGNEPGVVSPLPEVDLGPGETLLLWADKTPEQGPLHLPFKLAKEGSSVLLWGPDCKLADATDVPVLPTSESYARLPDGSGAFTACRYATPERENGTSCEPPPPPNIGDDVTFAPFTWPDPPVAVPGPLVISELGLRPASFVEVLNPTAASVTLADFTVHVASQLPGMPWPTATAGVPLAWPSGKTTLGPGERVTLPVVEADVASIALLPQFEGVAAIFPTAGGEPSDRVDFMHWPDGATLARSPDENGRLHYCATGTPGEPNAACDPLPRRDVLDRTRSLATPGDFDALAEGGTGLGEATVKFVVDMTSGDVVHLLGTRDWALHYTWVRERIYGQPRLDRCNPDEAREFVREWELFSQAEYFRVEGRRFLLGTLIRHLNGLGTVEFTQGDAITGELMRRAFFAVAATTDNPTEWYIRPSEGRQIEELRKIEGTAPIVGPNAPYKDVTYQPLTAAVGYGVLTFVAAAELETAELGPNVIVVTDDVPNGSAFVGGLITEAFQTPLAHVNVLARARNTPNMALRSARADSRVAPLFGQLVRLEVRGTGFDLGIATPEEADAFWQSRKPTGPKLSPPRDLSVRGIVPLEERTLADTPLVGTKAAAIAELYRVNRRGPYCATSTVPLVVPPRAFAVPFAHYADHFWASGAESLLGELEQDPTFRADPQAHADGLARVRQLMLDHPVDPDLMVTLRQVIADRFGSAPLRFRSSSNTEDLATFNGAGLHTSASAELDASGEIAVEDALRTVWSSLWNTRAYDERDFGNVDQSLAAMGVLIHEASRSEAAQGVAISRNALHATRSDQYYVNVQIGEAAVTNPAPGVSSDEMVYTPWPRTPAIDYRSKSSLSRGQPVLSFPDVELLGCALTAIHSHFQPLIDPAGENRLFAMQIEFKVLKPDRTLLVKQARPYTFGTLEVPRDCREF